MRKANQEITDISILEEILTRSNICRLAMIDNGLPYILPFNFGYHENCIYIHSAPVGKKINILKENPLVCFEIEQHAEIIEDETSHHKKLFKTQEHDYGEFHVLPLKTIIYKHMKLPVNGALCIVLWLAMEM